MKRITQTQQINWRNFLEWSYTNAIGYVDIIGQNTIWFVDEEARKQQYFGQYQVVAYIHPIKSKELALKICIDTKHDAVRMYTGTHIGAHGFKSTSDHQCFYLGTVDSPITVPAWDCEMKSTSDQHHGFIASMLGALIKELADDLLYAWKRWCRPIVAKVESLSDTAHIVTRHFNEDDSDTTTLEIEITPEIEAIADYLNDDFLSPGKFYTKLAEMKELLKPLCPLDLSHADGWSIDDSGINGKPVICYSEWRAEQKKYHKLRTGHLYFASYMESAEDAGDCGTCNGAKCEFCREVYRDTEGNIHDWPDEE